MTGNRFIHIRQLIYIIIYTNMYHLSKWWHGRCFIIVLAESNWLLGEAAVNEATYSKWNRNCDSWCLRMFVPSIISWNLSNPECFRLHIHPKLLISMSKKCSDFRPIFCCLFPQLTRNSLIFYRFQGWVETTKQNPLDLRHLSMWFDSE